MSIRFQSRLTLSILRLTLSILPWENIINFDALVEESAISPEDLDIFQYVESANEVWRIIMESFNKNQ